MGLCVPGYIRTSKLEHLGNPFAEEHHEMARCKARFHQIQWRHLDPSVGAKEGEDTATIITFVGAFAGLRDIKDASYSEKFSVTNIVLHARRRYQLSWTLFYGLAAILC